MKRLLFAVAILLMAAAAFADVADRDVLLTPDGTLYIVESVENSGSAPPGVTRYLQLTIQRPNAPVDVKVVPDSLTAGVHWRPALAYDNDSKTLFVFWLKTPNAMSSELLLSSYNGNSWQPAVSIDDQQYSMRYNLRIAITRKLATQQNDLSVVDVPALLIHAVWWEQTGYSETARYALFAVQKGMIGAVDLHNLDDFAPTPGFFPNPVDSNFNPEILKHPAFADNGTQDSIDVVYGDTHNNDFVRVRLKPIQVEGRIHIPIGAHPGGPMVPAAKSFTQPWTGPITIVTSPHDDGGMLLYNTTATAVNYIVYSNGVWSTAKSVPLSDKLTADAAVAALTRMLSQ